MNDVIFGVSLSMFASGLISVLMAVVPRFDAWFSERTPVEKRGIVAMGILFSGLLSLALGCFGLFEGMVTECSQTGIEHLIMNIGSAFVASQSTFTFVDGLRQSRQSQ